MRQDILAQKPSFPTYTAILITAIVAIGLWHGELRLLVGWPGDSWLWSGQYSIFIIALLSVAAYLLPVRRSLRLAWRRLWLPAAELYLIVVIAFFICKSIIYTLFSSMSFFGLDPIVMVLMLAALLYMTSSSFFYLTRNQFYAVKGAFIPLLIGAQLLIASVSWLSAWVINPGGSLIDTLMLAVKYGFPFFWAPLVIGLFSVFSLHQLRKVHDTEHRREILDDVDFPE